MPLTQTDPNERQEPQRKSKRKIGTAAGGATASGIAPDAQPPKRQKVGHNKSTVQPGARRSTCGPCPSAWARETQ